MIVVVGIGNPDRGDDAAGLLVARRIREITADRDVRVIELIGDQLGLLDAWAGARQVYVIDAVYSGGPVGALYRFDDGWLDARFARRGTHTFSLADVIALGRALGRLPERLAGYGIEGGTFEVGAPLSPAVEAAIGIVTSLLDAELKAGALAMCLGMTGVVTGLADDEGVPMALLDAGRGELVSACLLTCPDAAVGDTVLVHSGYVLRILDHREVR